MRKLAATALGLGISLGVLAMMCLQRYVAEIDDSEGRRAPETHANDRVGPWVWVDPTPRVKP